MNRTHYLIVGSSHAALEALAAIRMQDPDSPAALVTRDRHLPYSPTVLPYVVSGHSAPERIKLRTEAYFADLGVDLTLGDGVAGLDTGNNTATLESGTVWHYEKLLLATGATPAIPPIAGLADRPYHVLRTLDDAMGLREAMKGSKKAVVLGAGLVGMHAAENMAHAGLDVTVVEMCAQVLPGYFTPEAAKLIETTFTANGVAMRMGDRVTAVDTLGVTLEGGDRIECDLLLVATGVRPVTSYLNGSPIETDKGILVDETMRTSVANVWAAGDVAQARSFLREGDKEVAGILPEAVEQGRIAGMAMSDDPALAPYPGGVPINTYVFFGQQAVSVGDGLNADGMEVDEVFDRETASYRRVVLDQDKLRGISVVNQAMDAGIMWQLILRGVDLKAFKADFFQHPLETGRILMSRLWR